MSPGYRSIMFLVIVAMLLTPAVAFSAPAQQGGSYIVRPGDTLAKIAARFGVSTAAVARANGIANVDRIYVGQRLVIPGQGGAAPAKPATDSRAPAASSAAPAAAGGTYVVRRGDTLNKIAARFGTSVSALMAANGLRNPNFIYVGQRLKIPGAGTAPTAAPQRAPQPAPGRSAGGKWIDVNLSQQRLTAYEGNTPVMSVLVSTGTSVHPTVVGRYAVRTKIPSQAMSGPGYYLPNVPYVMYFYAAYALHGTYWHNNFGHPMSHGCVNLTIPDAAWLYNWASIGTPVVTHY